MSTSVDSHRGAGPSGEDGEPDDATTPMRRPAPEETATERFGVPGDGSGGTAGPAAAGWFDAADDGAPAPAPDDISPADPAPAGDGDADGPAAEAPTAPASAADPTGADGTATAPGPGGEGDGVAAPRPRRRSRGLRVPTATGAGPTAGSAPAATTGPERPDAPPERPTDTPATPATSVATPTARPRPTPGPRPSPAPRPVASSGDRDLPVGGPPPSPPKEPPKKHTAALGRLALVLVLVAAVVGTVVVLQQRSQFGRTDAGAEEIPALEVAPAQVDLNTVGQPNAIAPPSALLPGTAATPQPGRAPTISAWANGLAPKTNVPAVALQAYGMADLSMRKVDPGCHLSWVTVAGLARIESNHGRYRGATITPGGDVDPRIVGVPLDGTSGNRTITDTDGGLLDGDPTLDRAVGPLQFIPSTWAKWRSDGNGDGRADPNNIFDAALAAGRYLCAGGRDLATGEGWRDAVLSYNYSDDYGRRVYAAAQAYANSTSP